MKFDEAKRVDIATQKSNYDASLARLEQAVLAYRKSILIALRETSDALVAYDRYGGEIRANEQRAVLARESLRLAELRYKAGVATLLGGLLRNQGTLRRSPAMPLLMCVRSFVIALSASI